MTPEFDQISIPEDGEAIDYSDGFRSPDAPILPVAHGADDEIITATRNVLDAVADLMGREIHWLRIFIGEEARDRYGEAFPVDSIRALRRFRVGLVGRPECDPRTLRDVVRRLYSEIGLTVSMERRSRMPRVPSPIRNGSDIDLTVFRDVTEDVAAGIEYEPDTEETTAFREWLLETGVERDSVPSEPVGFGVRPISADVTSSLVEIAMEYALDRDRRSLTLVQQADLLPATEGAFLRWARESLADEYDDVTIDESTFEREYGGTYPDDEIVIRERYTDEVCRELLTRPAEYDVVVAPSLGGSYVSALGTEAIGGSGMAPQVAVGDRQMVAGPQLPRSTSSDAARENPTGTILSGCLLFEFLGWEDTAAVIRDALSRTLADGLLPRELYRRTARGTPVSAEPFADAVIERLTVDSRPPGAGGVRTSHDEREEIRRVIAGLYSIVFEDQLSPRDIELNQLLDEDEEADVYLPEVGLNFYYWRRWSVERRLEVLLHELAHVEEEHGERDHGDEFYDRLVELTELAADWEPELESLFGEPIDFDQVYRYIVESIHEETIEPDLERVQTRCQTLRDQFGIDEESHY